MIMERDGVSTSWRSHWSSLLILAVLIGWQFIWSVRTNLQEEDSTYNAALSFRALNDSSLILGFRSEFLLGFGGIEWGTLRWLEPISLAGVLGARLVNAGPVGGDVYHPAFASSMAVVLLWGSTFFLSRSFDIGKVQARLNATIAAAMGVGPGLLPILLPDQFRIVPPFVTFAAATSIAVGAAVRMTRVNWGHAALLYLAALTYLLLVHTHYVVLPGFVCVIAISVVLAMQIVKRESWLRLFLTTLGGIVMWWITGLVAYVRGFLTHVAAVEYGDRFVWNYLSSRPLWSLPFRSVFVRPEETWLAVIAALVGTWWVWTRIRKPDTKEQIAAAISALLVLAVTLYRASQRWWSHEMGPDVGYLSQTFIPFVAVAIGGGLSDLVRVRARSVRYVLAAVVSTALVFGVIQSWPQPHKVAPFPDKLQPSWEYLRVHTSLREDPRFRGRTAVIRQMEETGNVVPDRFFDPGVTLLAGIPLLNHYSHLQTPTGLEFSEQFLFRQGDPQIRHLPGFRQINPRILEVLGVRYIVTDSKQPIVGYEPVFQWSEQQGSNIINVRILESSTYNDASFSPTSIRVTETLREGLSLLADQDVDLKTTAVTSEGDLGSLSRADSASLDYISGDLRVQATSSSRSLLVIPVEFSHCWTIHPRPSSSDDIRLIRVNVLQLGVLFSGKLDADLLYRFWPMRNSDCRANDLREHRAGFP
jgi:hypothetical protein